MVRNSPWKVNQKGRNANRAQRGMLLKTRALTWVRP